jgi:CheY-like chemotaxis protein
MLLCSRALREPLSAAPPLPRFGRGRRARTAVGARPASSRSGGARPHHRRRAIIALDIQDLVERCGHSVVGIAATEAEAVRIARAERPSLVLADINLGAGGDGATAVSRILRDVPAPVIFVTAFPERLLTGDAVEPAFVITKPFDPTTLAVATYQAVTRGVRPV